MSQIFLGVAQNLTHCYKYSGITVETDPPLKIHFRGGLPPRPPLKMGPFLGRVRGATPTNDIFRGGWGGDLPPKKCIFRGGSPPHPSLQMIFNFIIESYLIKEIAKHI